MKKETLTLAGVQRDLGVVTGFQIKTHHRHGNVYIHMYLVVVEALGAYLRSAWLALAGLIPVVVYWTIVSVRKYKPRKQNVERELGREDVSVSVVRFSHISHELIYEPQKHRLTRGGKTVVNEAVFYHFEAGACWREPPVRAHYKWSRDFYLSRKGLENIADIGDEFYYVCLQNDPDISYIYPCELFELDAPLREKTERDLPQGEEGVVWNDEG